MASNLLKVANGDEGFTTGDVKRDKLLVDTSLSLLAKWSPRLYGDNMQLRLADANGAKLDTAPLIGELLGMLAGVAPSDAQPAMLDVTPRHVESAAQPAIPSAPPAVRAFDNPSYRPRAKRALPVATPDINDLV